jgi:hypothetical protein
MKRKSPTDSDESVLDGVRRTAIVLAAVSAAAAFALFGPRSGVSLTIGAAIAIFNFFVLEKVMGRVLTPRTGMRFTDFAIPAMGFVLILLLITAILKWKAFDLAAGLAGLSVIVVAIAWQGARGLWK